MNTVHYKIFRIFFKKIKLNKKIKSNQINLIKFSRNKIFKNKIFENKIFENKIFENKILLKTIF